MKLYIPTSSLNTDNILSTESVAPYSFYKARNYGYNSFCCLEMIPFKNVLLLFSKIPNFIIRDEEHDNRSVIIEINVNEDVNPLTLITEHGGTKVYSTDTIIRLTPFNTRLLFFNPEDLKHTKLSCSDSLTNKLGDRFHFDLCKSEFDLVSLLNTELHVVDTCNDYEQKVYQDNKLNTIKGFIIGYYLGVSKSITPDSAILLRIQKRIYDIVATIKNNGILGNEAFYNELVNLDKEYRKNDPCIKECRELWEKALEELSIPSESLNKLLEVYDEKNVLKNTFMKKNGLQHSILLSQYGLNNIELYRDDLKNYTFGIISKERQKKLSDFDVKKTFDLDPSYETCMLSGEDQDSMIFNKFIDVILWHGVPPTPDSLRTDRFNIATQITISAKNIWEKLNWNWQDSEAQIFMNELRQNIKSFTPFDVTIQTNIILKSIAAFVLKGEDYDSIVQFCEDNSYPDYRYALALWGATIGYVKMSKPVISTLTNSSYFCNTYKDIITLLYHIESAGELSYVQELVVKSDNFTVQKPAEVPAIDVKKWQNGIREYLSGMKKVQRKQILMDVLERAFIENGNQTDYVKFFAILNDYEEWKKANGEPITAWKNLVDHFCPEEYKNRFGVKSPKSTPVKKSEQSIFDGIIQKGKKIVEQLAMPFMEDEEAQLHEKVGTNPNSDYPSDLPYINSFINFTPIVLRRLSQNWKFTESKYPQDRSENIKFFVNLCKKEGRGQAINGPTSLTGVFTEEIGIKAEQELRDLFHV